MSAPPRSLRTAVARLVLATGASVLIPTRVAAQDPASPPDSAQTLSARLRRLEERFRQLDSITSQRASAGVRAGPQGFQLAAPDGSYAVRLRGYFQSDARTAVGADRASLPSGFLLRRVRPIIEATIATHADVRIMPDFGEGRPSMYEAYMEVRLPRAVTVRSGKFKPPLGLERLQSATDLAFIERAHPTNLVPNRDVGVQVAATVAWTTLSAGVFNGVGDLGFGDGDADRFKDVAWRAALEPLKGRSAPMRGEVIIALAGSRGTHRGTAAVPQTQAYRTPMQETMFRFRADGTAAGTTVADGEQVRLTPQAFVAIGRFSLMAEQVRSSQSVRRDSSREHLRHTAWQATATAVLTGERASYRGLTPVLPFDPSRGRWGAIEFAARLSALRVDARAFPTFADPMTQVRRARTAGVAMNWHFAKGVKAMLNYNRTDFEGGAVNGDRPRERNLSLRVQHAF